MRGMKTYGASTLLATTLLATGTCGIARAAGPVSDIVTSSADAVFLKTGAATLTITPRTDLMAGTYSADTVLATVKIEPPAPTDKIVYRWSPGVGVKPAGYTSRDDYREYSGKNKSENKLVVSFKESPNSFNETDWFKASAPGTVTESIKTPFGKKESIAPDIYTLSLDAAVWAD